MTILTVGDTAEYRDKEISVYVRPLKKKVLSLLAQKSDEKIIEEVAKECGAEIIYVTIPNILIAFRAAAVAKKLKIKFFLDVRDQLASFGIKRALYLPLERKVFRSAEKLTFTNPFLLDHYRKKYQLDPQKCSFFLSGFPPNPPLKQKKKSSLRFDLIHYGNINDSRDPEFFLPIIGSLLESISDLRVAFVGFNELEPKIVAFLEMLAQKFGDRVYLESASSPLISERHFINARIGLVSVKSGGLYDTMFPAKIFDYIKYGIPTLAICDDKELAIEGFFSIFPCGHIERDPEKIYIFTRWLREDQKSWQKWHSLILKSSKYFSPDICLKDMYSFLLR